MKTARNVPCPCGSGLKYKKCCLSKRTRPEAPAPARESELFDRAIPPPVIEAVMKEFLSIADTSRELDAAKQRYSALLEFAAGASAALPPRVGSYAVVIVLALLRMFERHYGVPAYRIDEDLIEHCIHLNGRFLLDFLDSPRGANASAGTPQPFLLTLICDLIQDLGSVKAVHLTEFGRFNLFLMLKTTVDVLDHAFAPALEQARAAAAP